MTALRMDAAPAHPTVREVLPSVTSWRTAWRVVRTWDRAGQDAGPAVRVVVIGWAGAVLEVTAARTYPTLRAAWRDMVRRGVIVAAVDDEDAFRSWRVLAAVGHATMGRDAVT